MIQNLSIAPGPKPILWNNKGHIHSSFPMLPLQRLLMILFFKNKTKNYLVPITILLAFLVLGIYFSYLFLVLDLVNTIHIT